MIRIDNLKKAFNGFQAVDGITFNVSPGEVLGFLGPNGAGKSTTMKMLTGFITPDSGSVSLCGFDVSNDPVAAKSLVGYLPEGAPAYGDMTPLNFLSFIADIRGLLGKHKTSRIDEVIHLLELQSVCNRPIDTLSKGFKRRVGIAQAILHDPQILILDEPTDGLDPNQKYQVRELIRGLAKEKIVIISTHILEEVTVVCTRAIVIARGRVLADATPSELEARSRYHRAVCIDLVDVPEEDAVTALESVAGAARVEVSSDHTGLYTVLPEPNGNLLNAVHDLAIRKGWNVQELFMERGRLDDVFRQLTTSNLGEPEKESETSNGEAA
ncbi:ABC transporter ATP-binding protein [Sansalvadorimonas sp. 2012CJ34-2]|uniref:ABC transporter ATP-binding protein n=1 Tax=Parendozoicomonas callyspongiae TaxID=2942213 RepID=A0ABT0PGN7_9GAMM|nr:ABC transporter ATP-binding protein [Sansalvadorimonas sp. 2012CJ34-2]MCL6270525.1 ABC transporter ATP-binding protein [Sansalvadorimonas sp. 2012CJ34-2]